MVTHNATLISSHSGYPSLIPNCHVSISLVRLLSWNRAIQIQIQISAAKESSNRELARKLESQAEASSSWLQYSGVRTLAVSL